MFVTTNVNCLLILWRNVSALPWLYIYIYIYIYIPTYDAGRFMAGLFKTLVAAAPSADAPSPSTDGQEMGEHGAA